MPSPRDVYVESGVGMAFDAGSAVWSFDLDLWGHCEQAPQADEALAAFKKRHGPVVVCEAIEGDELAFDRDRQPASNDELDLTVTILTNQRARCFQALADLPPDALDWDDPGRVLPPWARWRTMRQMLWHIADAESRYYLPSLGLASRPRARELATELRSSHDHVLACLANLPRDLITASGAEVWTTTKLLRRLAWHERGELDAIDDLRRRWAARSIE
ncbi:MAG: hypothetical protein Q4G64_05420 [bacterium]|nr:hypothetical protein [bacterium]